jgi:putative ABC transport system permease protein
MFFRMIWGSLWRQRKKMITIALTVALGVSLAAAMLGIMFDVGDKLNKELKSYGANISVLPKGAFLLSDLYGVENEAAEDKFLREDELVKIKGIFWMFNIVGYAPYLNIKTTVSGKSGSVRTVGTWYDYTFVTAANENFTTGIRSLKSWWQIDSGGWISDEETCCAMAGAEYARKNNIKAGDSITLTGAAGAETFHVKGIFSAGGDDDDSVYLTLAAAQALSGNAGNVSSIEVSALTTPDNELAKKATENYASLTPTEREAWYCTAYVGSIAYQIEEALTDAVAKPIRKVAESEGIILQKTELLMVLITVLSLVGAAVGITNLVTASVMERSKEIGLLKAVGAKDSSIVFLILTGIMITAVVGGILGFFIGWGLAQIIGLTVFSSAVALKAAVIPITAVAVVAVTLTGSIPAIKMLLSLKPAEVLHGR